MRFKLLICLVLSTVLVINPLANKHIKATLPKGEIETTDSPYISDSESEAISTTNSYPTDQEKSNPDDIPYSESEYVSETDDDTDEKTDSETDDSTFSMSSEYPAEYEICIIGRYLHTKGKKDEFTESHHIISSSFCKTFGLKPNDAPTICLPHRLHKRTGSYGSSAKAHEYRKQELQTLYTSIHQNLGYPLTNEDTLKKLFISLDADQKYECLQAVLKMGIEDLADKCAIYLQTRDDCMAKLDAELQRLAGKKIEQNPYFTEGTKEPKNCTYARRVSHVASNTTNTTDTTVIPDVAQKRPRDETYSTPPYAPPRKRPRVKIHFAIPHTPLRASARQNQMLISELSFFDTLGNIDDLFCTHSDSESEDDNFLKLPQKFC